MTERVTDIPSSKRRSQRYREIGVIFACALLLRVLFALATADTYDYDEFVILQLARDFAHGATPYHDFMFFHPPGVLVLFRLVEPLTNLWWPAARLLMVVVDSITAVLVWYIGTVLFDRRSALCAGLLYAASPVALVSAVRVGQDPLITILGIAGLAVLLSKPTNLRAALAGACLALAIWIKYPAAAFLLVYVLAVPRRAATIVLATLGASAVVFLPFLPEMHQLYEQTVTFQQTRWLMPLDQRFQTAAIFWIGFNLAALIGLMTRRYPLWLSVGFLTGGVFIFTPQVYYHYFVPMAPFAALLAAPLLARLERNGALALAAAGLTLVALWAAVIDLGGEFPLYVRSAHLSGIRTTIQYLRSTTKPTDAVLADRFEYPYLARRASVDHYFWNVGVLTNAKYLESHLSGAAEVVLSYGASSGYPAGFTTYLDLRYRRVQTLDNTIWIIRHAIANHSTAEAGQ